MLTIICSSKGGAGTTVVAAALALARAEQHGRSLLLDMCGDSRPVLGMADSDSPGLNDWLGEAHTSGADGLLALGEQATERLLVVHPGSRFVSGAPRWAELAAALDGCDFPVVIDAGTHFVPDELRSAAGHTWLVTRPCYLSLRRAVRGPRPTGAIVVRDEGRALTVRDVESVLNVPVVATVPVDSAVARAVDAGLLADRWQDLFGRLLPFG